MADLAASVPNRLRRVALVGLELIDPVTLTRVTRGVTVSAVGLANGPVLSFSGRFVWFAEQDAWPSGFRIDVGVLPFEPVTEVVKAPDKPADPEHTGVDARLTRVTLRPSLAYQFDAGVLGVRGKLREAAATESPPVAGAEIWLRWTFGGNLWLDSPVHGVTTESGAFAVFVQAPRKYLPKTSTATSTNTSEAIVSLQLAVRLAGADEARWKTLDDVPDGVITTLSQAVGLDELQPNPP